MRDQADFIVGIPRCDEPRDVLVQTLHAILASDRQPSRVLVVDNGTDRVPDDVLAELGTLPVDVIRPQRNLGCAGSWNLLHRLAAPLPVILLNADCAVAPDTFTQVLAWHPPAVVLAYAFGCFRVDEEVWRAVGDFDEAFYPVYFEDADYRRRLRLASVTVHEWPTTTASTPSPGRERATTGIEHGKHDPDGYQGWRGDKLAWFQERVAQNHERYRQKWGGEPGQETYETPFGPFGRESLDVKTRLAEIVSVLSVDPDTRLRVIPEATETRPTTRQSRIIPAYAPGNAPLGMAMNQNRLAVPTWSYAMETYPPARIVEIGTYNGGFTLALGVHAHHLGARVVTYDVSRAPDERFAALAAFLRVEFRTASVWDVESEIAELIASPGVTYVLCDGGDKRRELACFARYCKPGDVIAAHDYHTPGSQNAWWGSSEIRDEDGAAVAAAHGLEPWLQEHFDTAAWLTYRKR